MQVAFTKLTMAIDILYYAVVLFFDFLYLVFVCEYSVIYFSRKLCDGNSHNGSDSDGF